MNLKKHRENVKLRAENLEKTIRTRTPAGENLFPDEIYRKKRVRKVHPSAQRRGVVLTS